MRINVQGRDVEIETSFQPLDRNRQEPRGVCIRVPCGDGTTRERIVIDPASGVRKFQLTIEHDDERAAIDEVTRAVERDGLEVSGGVVHRCPECQAWVLGQRGGAPTKCPNDHDVPAPK